MIKIIKEMGEVGADDDDKNCTVSDFSLGAKTGESTEWTSRGVGTGY